MKKIILLATLVITVLHISAQTKAEEIKSPIVSEQDADYYATQTVLWRDIARSNPKDEQAWKNYFRAAWYKKWYNQADTTANDVLREMEQVIPGSYIYNYACYRKYMGLDECIVEYDTIYSSQPSRPGKSKTKHAVKTGVPMTKDKVPYHLLVMQ